VTIPSEHSVINQQYILEPAQCFITYFYYCTFVYCQYASYIYCVLCILYDVHSYCCMVPFCRMVSIPPPSISQWKAAGSNVKFPRCGEYSATLESTSHSAFQALLRHCSSAPPPFPETALRSIYVLRSSHSVSLQNLSLATILSICTVHVKQFC
jgi:hypothetical protein